MTKTMLKAPLLLLLTAWIAGLLAGCGGPAPSQGSTGNTPQPAAGSDGDQAKEPVTLQFWTIALQPTFNDYFNELIARYEKENPHVSIDWQDYPFDTVSQKLLTSIASNKSPDVVNLNTEFASQVGSKGALVDLEQYLTPEEKAAFFEGIFSSTILDGHAYALPWYTGTEVLFMNTKLLKEAGLDPSKPPQSREELADWARQIKAKTGKNGYAIQLISKLYAIDGIPFVNEDKTAAAFNTPEAEAMLQNLRQLMEEGVIIKDDAKFDKQIQYYSAEQVAFELAGPTFINFLKTSAPDVYKNTVAVPLPTGKANLRLSNSMNVVVPEASKHAEEAVKFAVFVTNAENQTSFAKLANTLPSTKASIKDPFFTESDNTLEAQAKIASAQSLDKATDFMVGVPSATDINAALGRGLQEVLLNGKDIKKTLDSVEKEVNGILKK
ncbi:ABC transporter substrate-binding protein [Paenibacillus sp. TH7-28]